MHRARVVLRSLDITADIYGVSQSGEFDYSRAVAELTKDSEALQQEGLIKTAVDRQRRRRPDGSIAYTDRVVGYVATDGGLRAAALHSEHHAKSLDDLRRAHEQAATDLYHVRQFAIVQRPLDKLSPLATGLAQTEPWAYQHTQTVEPYPILSSYIDYTFQRCRDQNKIRERTWRGQRQCIFNTGLLTPKLERIYGLFDEARDRSKGELEWFFVGFYKESDPPIRSFKGDPPADRATYFDRPEELVFDNTRRFTPDYDHLLDDHVDRYPQEMQGDDEDARQLRHSRLLHAIPRALMKLEQNYKTAIPQFFWPSGGSENARIQLLLPLYLSPRERYDRADLGLVVDPHPSGASYTAATSLPLDWAYKNARLVARPDRDWLDP